MAEGSGGSPLPSRVLQLSFPTERLRRPPAAAETLSPFWTASASSASEGLWLPTEAACADLQFDSAGTRYDVAALASLPSSSRVVIRATTSSAAVSVPVIHFQVPSTSDGDEHVPRARAGRLQGEKPRANKEAELRKRKAKADEKAAVVNQKRLRRGLGAESPSEREAREIKAAVTTAKSAATKARKAEERRGLVTRSRTYRLQPDAEQRATLRQWFGCARVTYNQGVQMTKDNDNRMPAFETLRSEIVYSDAPFARDRPWLLETPKEVRAEALRDLTKALSSNLAKRRQNPAHRFELKFRSRHAKTQSIAIPKDAITLTKNQDDRHATARIYPRSLGDVPLTLGRGEELVVAALDCRLSMDRTGAFFLHVPFLVAPRAPRGRGSVVAVDPGVRTFAAFYSPDGIAGEIGSGIDFLEKLERRRNKLRALAERKGHRRGWRRSHRRAADRVQVRIENRRSDLHAKAARFLCANFDTVLLPKFSTAEMAKKRPGAKINKTTRRRMYLWAHFKFRQRLLATAQLTGTTVGLVDESFTSKTCGRCGVLHETLGAAKTFRCPRCDHVEDRDIGAARKIIVRCCA